MKTKPILISFGLATSSVTSHAVLIAHYTFDADGSAAVGTDATLGDAASITTDARIGAGALALSGAPTVDGNGDDSAVGGDTLSWSSSDVRTTAFWMKAASGDKGDGNATMLSLGSGNGTGNRFDVRLNGNNLRLELQGGGSSTSSTIADGSWHHIAIVVPNAASTLGQVQYYLDGSLVGTFSGGTAINTGTGPLRVGDSYHDVTRDFKGSIDDVRLYDNALDSAAVLAIYNVPEPSTSALLGLGGLALILRRRK